MWRGYNNERTVEYDTKLYEILKEYRIDKSREEGIKSYFLFSYEELEDIAQRILRY